MLRLCETLQVAVNTVLTCTERQLLVTDQTATILSNFLAVFLALAARSLYNIVRRVLRVFTSDTKTKVQISVDPGPVGVSPQLSPTDGLNEGVDTPPAQTVVTDSNDAASASSGMATTNEMETEDARERRIERLEIIDESHDTETLIMKNFRKFIALLRDLKPIRPLGDRTPTYRRLLTIKFWSDMFRIANETSGDLWWHLLVGLGALILYFGALLLGIMSAYPVVGDSVAISHHP